MKKLYIINKFLIVLLKKDFLFTNHPFCLELALKNFLKEGFY